MCGHKHAILCGYIFIKTLNLTLHFPEREGVGASILWFTYMNNGDNFSLLITLNTIGQFIARVLLFITLIVACTSKENTLSCC